jgi:hypothetical protein
MKFLTAYDRSQGHCPTEGEIATLALKFYQDSNCEEGHDRENWLCAEYMLTQKQLIHSQMSAIHDRHLGPISAFSE